MARVLPRLPVCETHEYYFEYVAYANGWHPSCPPLIRLVVWTRQKVMLSMTTQGSLLAPSGIGKFPRLLRPVGPAFMSQKASPGSCSHNPYRLSACQFCTPFFLVFLSHENLADFRRSQKYFIFLCIIEVFFFSKKKKVHYTDNNLIGRSPILRRLTAFAVGTVWLEAASQLQSVSSFRQL